MKQTIVFLALFLAIELHLALIANAACSLPEGDYYARTWFYEEDRDEEPSATSYLTLSSDDCVVYKGHYHDYDDDFVLIYTPSTGRLSGAYVDVDDRSDWGAIDYRWDGTSVAGRWVAYSDGIVGYERWTL